MGALCSCCSSQTKVEQFAVDDMTDQQRMQDKARAAELSAPAPRRRGAAPGAVQAGGDAHHSTAASRYATTEESSDTSEHEDDLEMDANEVPAGNNGTPADPSSISDLLKKYQQTQRKHRSSRVQHSVVMPGVPAFGQYAFRHEVHQAKQKAGDTDAAGEFPADLDSHAPSAVPRDVQDLHQHLQQQRMADLQRMMAPSAPLGFLSPPPAAAPSAFDS